MNGHNLKKHKNMYILIKRYQYHIIWLSTMMLLFNFFIFKLVYKVNSGFYTLSFYNTGNLEKHYILFIIPEYPGNIFVMIILIFQMMKITKMGKLRHLFVLSVWNIWKHLMKRQPSKKQWMNAYKKHTTEY